MTLGKKISLLRRQIGISQEDLANELNVSRQAVQKWEHDTSTPEVNKLVEISNYFSVSLDYLLKDNNEETITPTPVANSNPPVVENNTVNETTTTSTAVPTATALSTTRVISLVLIIIQFVLVTIVHILVRGFVSGIAFSLGNSVLFLLSYILLYKRNIYKKGATISIILQIISTAGMMLTAVDFGIATLYGIGLNILYIIAMLLLLYDESNSKQSISQKIAKSQTTIPDRRADVIVAPSKLSQLEEIESTINKQTYDSIYTILGKLDLLAKNDLNKEERQYLNYLYGLTYLAKATNENDINYAYKALSIFTNLENFKDSKEKVDETNKQITKINIKRETDFVNEITIKYPTALVMASDLVRIGNRLIEVEAIYKAIEYKTDTMKEIFKKVQDEGINYLTTHLSNYIDKIDYCDDCEQLIHICNKWTILSSFTKPLEERLVVLKKKRKIKYSIAISIGVVIIAAATILPPVINSVIQNNKTANTMEIANDLMERNLFNEARLKYEELGDNPTAVRKATICGHIMNIKKYTGNVILSRTIDAIKSIVFNGEVVEIGYNTLEETNVKYQAPTVPSYTQVIDTSEFSIYNPEIKGYSLEWVLNKVSYKDGRTILRVSQKTTIERYSITYYDAGFDNEPTSYTIEDGTIIQLSAPSQPLHIFKGWYDNPNYNGEPITSFETSLCKDVSLYAKWEESEGLENFTYHTITHIDDTYGYIIDGLKDNSIEEITIPSSITDDQGTHYLYSISKGALGDSNSKIRKLTTSFIGKDSNYNSLTSSSDYQLSYLFNGETPSALKEVIITSESNNSIPEYAFKLFPGIETITLSEGIKEIGSLAFYNCSSLETITIPNSIETVHEAPINNCKAMSYNTFNNANYLGNESNPYLILVKAKDYNIINCTINSGTRIILSNAFVNCNKLTSIIIPDKVTSIGNNAFALCSALTTITTDTSIKEIGNYTFENCSSLSTINYNGTMEEWDLINLGLEWKKGTPKSLVIHCSDGDK